MQIKVYIPKMIEIPSEYLPALAKRAADSLGDRSHEVSATRGHLVRQAVQDGLLREFDPLIGEDGTVDWCATRARKSRWNSRTGPSVSPNCSTPCNIGGSGPR